MTTTGQNPSNVTETELAACDREPIHIPGSIQPHGLLLVLDPAGLIIQASQNAGNLLGHSDKSLLGKHLGQFLGEALARELLTEAERAARKDRPVFVGSAQTNSSSGPQRFNCLAHCSARGLVLELELTSPTESPQTSAHQLSTFVESFTFQTESVSNVAELARTTAIAVRELTGFDRVLIYHFEPDGTGIVVGEDGNGRLPALLNHRFPASDIPAQARELYRLSRVRIIPDSSYEPVSLVAVAGADTAPLDMTYCTLRSVSPVHVEYMRNMETAASMSISILRDGKLWGLISCHHREPRHVPFAVRTTCDLTARAFSLRLSALEYAHDYERRFEVRSLYAKLLAIMADRGDFATSLSEHSDDLLGLVRAQGAAVLTDDQCYLIGVTPSEQQVRTLAAHLFSTFHDEVFISDSLSTILPDADNYTSAASGLLAVAVSKLHSSYMMWFRCEVVQTVLWGGNPHKAVETNGGPARLHPRKSFESWSETVRHKALPWEASEIDAARDLRNAIVGIVLRKAEELAALNEELTRSNKELESFSYSVSHDLRAPLRHIVGYAQLLKDSNTATLTANDERCLNTIIESSEYAGNLVEKLLGYSRLGRAELQLAKVNMNELVRETQANVMRDAEGRQIEWHIHNLPTVTADLVMLRMAVRDLLANAVKYSRQREVAVIEVAHRTEGAEDVIWVKDNGIGFDMQYVDKLFGVFQRLHRWEDFEGTGIGLANVRRVIERHGGRTWAEGQEGVGATFYFTLPRTQEIQG